MPFLSNGSSQAVTPMKTVDGWVHDIESQLPRIPQDIGVVKQLVEATLSGGLTDDKKWFLEHLIQLVASLPDGSSTAASLTGRLLSSLWDNLKHPPLSYMGDEWKYRACDGSRNNKLYPDIGKAGSAYARSVVPQHSPPAALPDPGTIFDAVMAREGPAREHPTKLSSLAVALATIIIHDLFRTNDRDPNKVASSSYLDLGPLYGHNEDQQKTVRTYKDGKLKPDAFTELRLLGQPPAVPALLVCFNRFHNYVVEQLALINENLRFSIPAGILPGNKDYDKAVAKRDNDLFQTGRLVTCGLYVNIILNDYVRVILNLNRSNTTWGLDPRIDTFNPFDDEGIPKGIGNQVSIEFNLIYRWHPLISDKNARWVEAFFAKIFPNKDPSNLTQKELTDGLLAWGRAVDPDPGKWTFGELKRGASGSFEDTGLARLLVEEIEDCAGAFGARNTPAIMRAIEVLGINQGRNWGTASLNEVRKFFKLTPHATFKDINSDPQVATALEALYTHPDNVEYYPGLIAEEGKPPMVPGAGLCSGATIAKGILSDAVALTRGDRYYAVDSSPANLTAFGFTEIASDPHVAGGGVIYKLFQRALPGWFSFDSVYAILPLTIPSENKKILQDLGKEKDFNFDPPTFTPPPTPVLSWQAIVDTLKDQVNYKVPWGPHVYELTHHDWMLSGDKPWNSEQKKHCEHALYDPKDGLDEIRKFYEITTTKLVHDGSNKLRHCYQIDAVRDVGNLSHAIVTAHLFRIPLTEQGGDITAQQLYEAMAAVFAYTFLDLDPAQTFSLRVQGRAATAALERSIAASCKAVKMGGSYLWREETTLHDYGTALIRRLFEGGKTLDEVIWTIVPTAAAAAPIQSQGFARMLDFYLTEKNKHHWEAIQMLAKEDTPEAFEKLRKYALEAFRLATPAAGVLRTVDTDCATIHDGEREVQVKKGESIFLDFVTAGLDPTVFPDAQEIKLDRPDESYIHHGYAGHVCLGRQIVMIAMAVQLRVFAKLKNLRRAPGPAGQLKTTVSGAFTVYMNEDWSSWTPFPATWKLHYDEDCE